MQGSLTSHLPYFRKTPILGLCIKHKCDFHKHRYANIYSRVDQLGVHYILRQSTQQWNKWPNDPKHFFQAQLVQISVRIFLHFTRFKSSYDVKSEEVLLSFPYMICILWEERVEELDVTPMVHLLEWFICLLGRGSFHFVPCLPFFFFGCFSQFMVSLVSSFRVSR